MNKAKIGVAMSGGVDSTTTASLLKEQGHDIFGATMYLFDVKNEKGEWTAPSFIQDAREACEKLDIEHYVIDLRDVFRAQIIQPFIDGYLLGETPNPCALCNPKIKYGLFMDAVMALGADYMATGHYVRISHDEKGVHLLKGTTARKDQSFYLYGLSQERLSKIILPLGNYSNKEEVRALASEHGLKAANKKDSLGVCFTQGQLPFDFIRESAEKGFGHGNFVGKNGEVLGVHEGYYQFTVGQKKGLPSGGIGEKSVVTEIRPETFEVVLGTEADLYHGALVVKDVKWIHEPKAFPWQGIFRICTWGYDLKGRIEPVNNEQEMCIITFDEPVRAIAIGQACVIYKGDEIVGGGIICEKY